MGMHEFNRRWNREEVLALPDDGNRYELVDGQLLVSPSPRGLHQRAVLGLIRRLDPHVAAHGLGALSLAPADLDLGSGQLVQPDVFVGAAVDGREPVDWGEFGIPLLVVEVLSPSTAGADRLTKRRRYQRSGVPIYWIVDVEGRAVEVWTPEAVAPVIVRDALVWAPPGAAAPLVIDLVAYFSWVCQDPY